MIPARVEPCLATFMKTSPGRPSSYSPTVTKPLQSATRNSKVRDRRVRGSLSRVGCWTTFSTMRSTTCAGASSAAGIAASRSSAAGATTARGSRLAVDSGWATLQLSR